MVHGTAACDAGVDFRNTRRIADVVLGEGLHGDADARATSGGGAEPARALKIPVGVRQCAGCTSLKDTEEACFRNTRARIEGSLWAGCRILWSLVPSTPLPQVLCVGLEPMKRVWDVRARSLPSAMLRDPLVEDGMDPEAVLAALMGGKLDLPATV